MPAANAVQIQQAGQLETAMAAFQGNLIRLIDFLRERDREGTERENRATIFLHMVYLSVICMCVFNWMWQNYVRPEVTIPMGLMAHRLAHVEDFFVAQNAKLDYQNEKLAEHSHQLELLVLG